MNDDDTDWIYEYGLQNLFDIEHDQLLTLRRILDDAIKEKAEYDKQT